MSTIFGLAFLVFLGITTFYILIDPLLIKYKIHRIERMIISESGETESERNEIKSKISNEPISDEPVEPNVDSARNYTNDLEPDQSDY